MQSCHVCQSSLLAYEEKSIYGHQDACESSEYSLTKGSRRLCYTPPSLQVRLIFMHTISKSLL
jgi:hypothetical protein